MRKSPWKWRKSYLLSSLFLTLLVIGIGCVWIYQLNSRITQGLESKKFLPPTQYFTAPESIFPHMLWTRADLAKKLEDRSYKQKPWGERLRPGEFSLGTSIECLQILNSALPPDAASCLLLEAKDVDDSELKTMAMQMMAFGSDDLPLAAFHGNPLTPSEALWLEPEVFAQYLGNEPIQQNYTVLGEIPVACLNAVLAIEDPKYLEHSGVSMTAIARAAFRNLAGSRIAQGGSTITQQMVKNYFLTSERTLQRKATEFFMSLILEAHVSKDQIFETYLNIIYLGQNGPFQIRGFPAAAKYYFGKNLQELELPDCALLAAVLNSPGLYDPFHKPDNAKKRRNLVLEKMAEHSFISPGEASQAKNSELPTRATINVSETAPYYVDAVQKELTALSIPTQGMKIFTGLNLQAQNLAQRSVQEQLARLEQDNKKIKALHSKGKNLESVLLSANNKTGLIEAIVGGRNYKLTQFNRAVDGHRQIGSIMKPFVYLAALESSDHDHPYTPATILHDSRFKIEYAHQSWSPENYGKEYFGDVPMYVALKNSLNCATASLGLAVGLEKIISLAQATGIQSRLDPVPSVTLGAFELAPKEVLQAYSTFANLGEKHSLRTVRMVLNDKNENVYKTSDIVEPSIEPNTTAVLVGMMKQTLISGTAKSSTALGFNYPAAGKTGTTSDNKDSWFGGFTPYLTSIVWVGYDDNTPTGLTGASGALPIWVQFMKSASAHYPAEDFKWPDGVVAVKMPDQAELQFLTGTEP